MNQWANITRRNKSKMLKVAKMATTAMADRIFRVSPVDTGLFKNNWKVGMNSPDTATTRYVAKTGHGRPAGAAFLRFKKIVQTMRLGDTLYFTNPLHYGWALEYGHSNQAPAGMVRVTVADWQGAVNRAARVVK
jgi:hypothetical protein